LSRDVSAGKIDFVSSKKSSIDLRIKDFARSVSISGLPQAQVETKPHPLCESGIAFLIETHRQGYPLKLVVDILYPAQPVKSYILESCTIRYSSIPS